MRRHSAGDASRLAALLLPPILPIFSVVAPCQPGASPPSVLRRIHEMSSPLPAASNSLLERLVYADPTTWVISRSRIAHNGLAADPRCGRLPASRCGSVLRGRLVADTIVT